MINPKWQRWIIAARPRTLPLSFTGPITGSCLAYAGHNFRWGVAIGAILTTLLLQVLSNFANDYGDFVKGTDQNRKGPARALQSKLVTVEEMQKAIYIISLLALIAGSILLFVAASHLSIFIRLLFFMVGLSAIYAAIKYTVGNKPYGYSGWGDAVVFLFFGLVSTLGTYMLHTGALNFTIILPAISMGLLSTAVLNVNNIRDYHEDISNNKRTLAVLLGIDRARIYHVLLISLAWVCLFIPVIISFHSIMQLLFVVTLPLFVKGIYRVYHFSAADELNSELKRLAMSSFLLALLWSLGQILATCN